MAKVLNTKIILRNDTAASWLKHNPILSAGEFGIEWDTGLFKIGNGTTAYDKLPYAGAPSASGSAILDADGYTLSANLENKLGLNKWGIEYHKWVNDHYELVPVSADNPWKVDLQPKVAQNPTTGTLELAWFEPSPISEEEISTLQETVNTLSTTVGTKEDAAGADSVFGAIAMLDQKHNELAATSLPITGGQMTGELILADGSPAVSEKIVDDKIAYAVTNMGTLKRKVVDVLPDIADADENIIYMIKKGTSLLSNSYDEYFLIEGAFELIGDTSADLEDYIKKPIIFTEGNIALFSNDGSITDANIAAKDISEHIADDVLHITAEERARWNAGIGSGEGPTYIFGGGLQVDEAGTVNVQIADESNGLTITDNGLALTMASDTTAGAMSAAQYTKLANTKEFSGVVLGDIVEATFDPNNKVHIPMANAVSPGVVVSSDATNAVAVDMMSGTMTVNAIETTKLVVPEGQELILNGGSAS